MNTISVSVIIATYRRNSELIRALDSLANQSCDIFEIILIDDNADPLWNKTVKDITDSFLSRNGHIPFKMIVNQTNCGSAKSRNIGIKEATGKYITFLDDDDEYLPEKIKNQFENIAKNNGDFGITDLKLYNEKGRLIDKRIRNYIKKTDSASLLKYHLMYHLTGTDSLMFKKDYLEKIGGFSQVDLGDEYYLMESAIQANGRFSYLNKCDFKAYVHKGETGLSSGNSKILCENELFEYKKTKFDLLDKKSVKYIKMRHFAVLSYVYLRTGNRPLLFANGAKCFLTSPIGCLKLIISRKI